VYILEIEFGNMRLLSQLLAEAKGPFGNVVLVTLFIFFRNTRK